EPAALVLRRDAGVLPPRHAAAGPGLPAAGAAPTPSPARHDCAGRHAVPALGRVGHPCPSLVVRRRPDSATPHCLPRPGGGQLLLDVSRVGGADLRRCAGGPRTRGGAITSTALAETAFLVVVVVDRGVARPRLTSSYDWWTAYAIIVFFQLLTIGW